MRAHAALVAIGLTALLATSCATYQDDLARGQKAFESNQHERALAIFRALEPDTSQLTTSERAHYAYLRGMTDYRIGYRAEARHWLSVARAIETETPSSLPSDWNTRLGEALKELNEEVYGAGVQALTNRKGDAREPTATPPKVKKPKSADDE